jgi:hypothetical protein
LCRRAGCGRAISPATTRSGRRTFPWPGRRPAGSRGALAGHRLIRRNVSFGKAEPSPNQCIRCAVPLDQREGACNAVRAGWRGDVFRHCSKNEPLLRWDTPFDRPCVDLLRSRRVIGQGRPCQSPSPPLPIGPLSGSVQQAGDPPDAPLFVLGEGLTNRLAWIASRRVVGGRSRRTVTQRLRLRQTRCRTGSRNAVLTLPPISTVLRRGHDERQPPVAERRSKEIGCGAASTDRSPGRASSHPIGWYPVRPRPRVGHRRFDRRLNGESRG